MKNNVTFYENEKREIIQILVSCILWPSNCEESFCGASDDNNQCSPSTNTQLKGSLCLVTYIHKLDEVLESS